MSRSMPAARLCPRASALLPEAMRAAFHWLRLGLGLAGFYAAVRALG
jgi:hypothetical protein